MPRVTALLLLASARGAHAVDCSACLVDNAAAFAGVAGATAHAWCYTTNQCMDITVSVFTACPDYTFDYDTCECRPDVYTTCDECASVSHMGCIWVANASVTQTVKYKLGPMAPATLSTNTTWKHGRCTRGSGFSPLGLQETAEFELLGISVNFTSTTVPKDWYWAQCALTGPAAAGLSLGVLALICCLVTGGCGLCYRRRRRLIVRELQQPIILGHAVQAQPVQVAYTQGQPAYR